MDKREDQKNNMPDFDSLDDRVIANHSPSPRVAAKTNLDVKNNKEENPYANNKDRDDTDERLFNEFFED